MDYTVFKTKILTKSSIEVANASLFEILYILDLHGNSKKRERAIDGSKDENVFDIQQGVAIGIFIKNKIKRDKNDGPSCRIFGNA